MKTLIQSFLLVLMAFPVMAQLPPIIRTTYDTNQFTADERVTNIVKSTIINSNGQWIASVGGSGDTTTMTKQRMMDYADFDNTSGFTFRLPTNAPLTFQNVSSGESWNMNDGISAGAPLDTNTIVRMGNRVLIANSNQTWFSTNLLTTLMATNNGSSSNVSLDLGGSSYRRIEIYLTNNITLTNFSGLITGTYGDVAIHLIPQLIPRGIGTPTLGSASFGTFVKTNVNSPIFTTVTNGTEYVLSISRRGTNQFWSMSLW